MTTAMKEAYYGKLPSRYYYHNPLFIENVNGRTVAMILAKNGIMPTKHW